MALRKTIESVRGIFTLKEYIYDSGLVEIGLFIAEVIEGAGPVLRGVISKQAAGDNWVGCTSRRSGVSIGRRKGDGDRYHHQRDRARYAQRRLDAVLREEGGARMSPDPLIDGFAAWHPEHGFHQPHHYEGALAFVRPDDEGLTGVIKELNGDSGQNTRKGWRIVPVTIGRVIEVPK